MAAPWSFGPIVAPAPRDFVLLLRVPDLAVAGQWAWGGVAPRRILTAIYRARGRRRLSSAIAGSRRHGLAAGFPIDHPADERYSPPMAKKTSKTAGPGKRAQSPATPASAGRAAAAPPLEATLRLPPPERRAKRSRAVLLKLTEEEHAELSRVAMSRGEPLATTARLLAVAAARAALGEG